MLQIRYMSQYSDARPANTQRRPERDLSGFYRIRLLKDGCRPVYQVTAERIIIYVIAAGRRACNEVCELAARQTD